MRVVFRTEGNHQQGMGDVWGSIALADQFTRLSDEVLFIVSGGEEAVSTIGSRGYQLQQVGSVTAEHEAMRAFRPDAIVVNKLNNPPEYIRSLKNLGGLVVTIDDSGDGARFSDLPINVLYPIPGAVCDPKHAALRAEFQMVHDREKPVGTDVRELLITQGGSDTYGFTPKIVRALEKMTCRPHCSVVTGPAFRHWADLETTMKASTLNVTHLHNVQDMAELMWRADLAITAGGLTMFELACVGTPSLVVCAEPFEVATAARLEKAGAVRSLGFGGDMDYEKVPKAVEALAADTDAKQRMSARGKELVDGRGCQRTVHLIKKRLAQLESRRP